MTHNEPELDLAAHWRSGSRRFILLAAAAAALLSGCGPQAECLQWQVQTQAPSHWAPNVICARWGVRQ